MVMDAIHNPYADVEIDKTFLPSGPIPAVRLHSDVRMASQPPILVATGRV
jgi:hypothetical protein